MKLLKIPFSAGGLGKTKGTELAPDEIVKELNSQRGEARLLMNIGLVFKRSNHIYKRN